MAAKEFFDEFMQANEDLKQLAFPERVDALFNDDFSDYPVEECDVDNVTDTTSLSVLYSRLG